MSIKFDGLDDVLEAIAAFGDVSGIQQSLGKACAVVERTAKEKAPKDTGELRRSITSRVDGIDGIVYTTLEYAPYVEYGTGLFATGEGGGRQDVPWHYQDDKGEWHETSGQHPQPYMKPALDENREEILRILKEGLKK